MTTMHDSRTPARARAKISADTHAAALVAAMTALACRLPALGAWWNQDDWGLLARAADILPDPALPARWLSQIAYWDLMWPLAGLDTAPYAYTRLALHALAAAGLVRLAARLDMSVLQQWLAGLIFAAAPLAFTALYWAAGVQDLLAVCLTVWALERWLTPGSAGRPVALLLAIGALASKETTVGVPLLMAAMLHGRARSRDWVPVGMLCVVAAGAVVLAFGHFDTGNQQPYDLGGPAVILGHLLTYGWWLLQPGPTFTPNPVLAQALVGGLLWVAWVGWGVWHWRRGRRTPALTALGALVMVAPLLPLTRHMAPDLAYPVEPFGCLALACLVPSRWRPRTMGLVAMVAMIGAWGFFGMRGRLSLRDGDGLPADPLVRRTAVSFAACSALPRLPVPEAGIVVVQVPLTREVAAMADDLGENWVTGSTLYNSLGGALGPQLILGAETPVTWSNALRRTPSDALVLLDVGTEFKPWGPTPQALLYQTLTDVGLGHFKRGRQHLLRASLLAGETLTIVFDAGLLPVPPARVLANAEAFTATFTKDADLAAAAIDPVGLRTNFERLLDACVDDRAPRQETP